MASKTEIVQFFRVCYQHTRKMNDSERIQEVLDHNWSKLKEWGAFSAIIHHNKRGEPVIVVLAFNGTDVSSFPKTLDGFDLFVSLGEIREQRNE